jgi:hypothetical protein
MKQQKKVDELRELLSVAKNLRSASGDANDSAFKFLFMSTAIALDEHAASRAFGSTELLSRRGADLEFRGDRLSQIIPVTMLVQ